jgi:hypothetical protein
MLYSAGDPNGLVNALPTELLRSCTSITHSSASKATTEKAARPAGLIVKFDVPATRAHEFAAHASKVLEGRIGLGAYPPNHQIRGHKPVNVLSPDTQYPVTCFFVNEHETRIDQENTKRARVALEVAQRLNTPQYLHYIQEGSQSRLPFGTGDERVNFRTAFRPDFQSGSISYQCTQHQDPELARQAVANLIREGVITTADGNKPTVLIEPATVDTMFQRMAANRQALPGAGMARAARAMGNDIARGTGWGSAPAL